MWDKECTRVLSPGFDLPDFASHNSDNFSSRIFRKERIIIVELLSGL
jgi:hypothetical protein